MGGTVLKCPRCGYQPRRGPPQKLNDALVLWCRENTTYSLQEIALMFDVTKGAIQASLKRTAKSRQTR